MTNFRSKWRSVTIFSAALASFSCGVVKPIVPVASLAETPHRTSATAPALAAYQVLRVTTLAAKGAGSLAAALADARPRLIVFEVGGVIDLDGHGIDVRNPHVIVAGQTAPDPGITLVRGTLTVETSDVLIQHIASRSGNAWSDDALGARRTKDQPVHDVVFDHCSATWAVDENLSVSGPADVDASTDPDITSHDVTLRNCLIAEGLSHSIHRKGEHSKGTLVHDGIRNVTITGCLYAHNEQRNPRLKGGTTATLTGNVMYNWGSQCVGVGAQGNQRRLAPGIATLTGNVAIAGPNTHSKVMVKSVDPGAKVTLRDNVVVDARGRSLQIADDDVVASVLSNDTNAAWRNAENVLRTAGSRAARRDAIDTRIVQSVIDGTGRIIDSEDQVGGYPVRPPTKRALIVPDGADERRAWLERLSEELSTDRTIDLTPLWKRLGVARPSQ
jgi:hypothetical protein